MKIVVWKHVPNTSYISLNPQVKDVKNSLFHLIYLALFKFQWGKFCFPSHVLHRQAMNMYTYFYLIFFYAYPNYNFLKNIFYYYLWSFFFFGYLLLLALSWLSFFSFHLYLINIEVTSLGMTKYFQLALPQKHISLAMYRFSSLKRTDKVGMRHHWSNPTPPCCHPYLEFTY